ncbi:hypothetical protein XELAEV_18022455mg [Xenopus laevis]|uniref:Uncharacterized protein n=1 Tax=Xenopus laevis TaxID=8355 RepID=A0A974D2E4_XENLA|nr:hypothetical protein XELAEV_18022455mg [Xenopus laevis]
MSQVCRNVGRSRGDFKMAVLPCALAVNWNGYPHRYGICLFCSCSRRGLSVRLFCRVSRARSVYRCICAPSNRIGAVDLALVMISSLTA